MSIRTRNLELIPNEPRHLLALYSGAESYQQLWLIRWIRWTDWCGGGRKPNP